MMAGPTSAADRRAAWRRLYVGFVAFVGGSSMLTAVYGGATLVETGLVGLGGVAVGAIVLVAMGARL